MTRSPRSPAERPSCCPLCHAATNPVRSSSGHDSPSHHDPNADAPCPRCGHLVGVSTQILSALCDRMAAVFGVPSGHIQADTTLSELGADSLASVELVLDIEKTFELNLHEDDVDRFETVGDIVRHIEQHKRPSSTVG